MRKNLIVMFFLFFGGMTAVAVEIPKVNTYTFHNNTGEKIDIRAVVSGGSFVFLTIEKDAKTSIKLRGCIQKIQVKKAEGKVRLRQAWVSEQKEGLCGDKSFKVYQDGKGSYYATPE